jgi:hypothetical protein
MGESIANHRTCPSCGRAVPGGRSLKCECGAVIHIPHAHEEPLEDYGLAEAPAAAIERPAAAARAPGVLGYDDGSEIRAQQRFYSKMIDPWRDLYIPVAMCVVGFVGIIVYAAMGRHGWAAMILPLVMALVAAVKTALLLAIAFFLAAKMDVSFGLFRTALLKFVAIVVFIDATRLWMIVFMKATHAISTSGKGPASAFWLDLVLMVALLLCALYYLFEIDYEESRWFVRLMVLSMVVVDVGFVIGTNALTNAARPRRVVAPVAVAPTTAPAAPAIAPTAGDKQIAATIVQGSAVFDARQWILRSRIPVTDPMCLFIGSLYAAGAEHVYVDVRGARVGRAAKAYVELPADPNQRRACMKLAAQYRDTNGSRPASTQPLVTRRFLVIDLF